MQGELNWLPTSPFPRDPLYPSAIYAGGSGPQTTNLDLEDEYFPFKVYVMERERSGLQAVGKVGVEYKSVLYKDENGFGNKPIVGLLTDRLKFDDAGWTDFPEEENIVYLKGTVEGGEVTEINVEWEMTPEELKEKKRIDGGSPVTPSNQTEFILPIARLFRYGNAPSPQKLGVEQYVKTNLLLCKVKFGEDEGWYPVPSPVGSGGGSTTTLPWQIILKGVGEPDENGKFNDYDGKVWPGTVGGSLFPSNVFSGSSLNTFRVGSGLMKWKCRCLTDGKQITSAQIVVDASDPPPQQLVPSALPAQVWFVFGLTAEGLTYRTVGYGNPVISTNQYIITDKTSSPPPGIPGVDRWYKVNFA